MNRHMFFVFLALSFIQSCARVELSTKGCEMPIGLPAYSNEKSIPFHLEKKVWAFGGPFEKNEILLREVLAEENLHCTKIQKIKLYIEENGSDFAWSLIPLVMRRTLIVDGEMTSF